jgi:hypothetical protein
MIRNIWNDTKKTLRFGWRHFFTLAILAMAIDSVINNEHPLLGRVLMTFFVAMVIDWIKSKIKFSPQYTGPNKAFGTTQSPQSSNPFNDHMVGTSSYLSNIGHR